MFQSHNAVCFYVTTHLCQSVNWAGGVNLGKKSPFELWSQNSASLSIANKLNYFHVTLLSRQLRIINLDTIVPLYLCYKTKEMIDLSYQQPIKEFTNLSSFFIGNSRCQITTLPSKHQYTKITGKEYFYLYKLQQKDAVQETDPHHIFKHQYTDITGKKYFYLYKLQQKDAVQETDPHHIFEQFGWVQRLNSDFPFNSVMCFLYNQSGS